MKKKVVISQSTVSAGQLKDLMRMIEDGTVGGEEIGAFLENPKKFSKGLTIVRAINILGANKVITTEQASKAWGLEAPKSAIIRYGEEVLRQCANENQSGKADWRLIYINGLSLREQREQRGTDKTKPPCFRNYGWWPKPEKNFWATFKPQSGYQLINFNGQFANLDWNRQEQEIAKLGNDFERCHETVFTEAVLTIYIVNNGERIAKNWYHWSASAAFGGGRIFVGGFYSCSLGVSDGQVDDPYDDLRVALARKFT